MTWHTPAPGTAAHRARTLVRSVFWGAPAVALVVLADPSARAGLLAALGLS